MPRRSDSVDAATASGVIAPSNPWSRRYMAAPDSRETCCSMISQTRVAKPAGRDQNGGAPCSSMTAANTGSSKTSRSTASRKVVSSRWVTIGLSLAIGTGPKLRESVAPTPGLSEITHASSGPNRLPPSTMSPGTAPTRLTSQKSSRPGWGSATTSPTSARLDPVATNSSPGARVGRIESSETWKRCMEIAPAGYGRLSKSTTKECHAADNDCPRPLRSLLRGV